MKNKEGYSRQDNYPEETTRSLSAHYREILSLLGEDAEREGLLKTPERVAKAMQFFTQGYHCNPEEILKSALFKQDYKEMIVVKDIEIYSLCEHHLVPFFGKAHVAYIPDGTIVGLSKIPRVVEAFARRLQIQERLTEQVATAIEKEAHAEGVGVVFRCRHLCMMMRGVEKQNSEMVTSAMLGSFREDEKVRAEFLSLIGR